MTTLANRPEPTPEQRARWDRRRAAFEALSNIDAQHAVALVEWLVPIAKRVADTPVELEADEYVSATLSRINLTEATDKAEEHLLLQQRWAPHKTTHEARAVLIRLASALVQHFGGEPLTEWDANCLYLLTDVLP